MKLLMKVGVPFDLTIHDYYLICPRVSLSFNGEYCGEPRNVDVCFKCLSVQPIPESQDIVTWRFDNLWLLQSAERVICPSHDVAKRISKYYSGDNIVVVPHQIIESIPKIQFHKTHKSDKLHIAVMGWLAPHKGLYLVKDAVSTIEVESLPIRITLIGSSLGRLVDSSSYRELGPYEDEDIESIIASLNPHILWLPSTVPETFSYTLSAAMRTGRPIFASNLGAFVERLANYPNYELFSVNAGIKNILKQAMDFSRRLEV
jgi:glycosyltransferase involved in cell wall biosynthesis